MQKALTWDWINNAAMTLQVPRKDKSEEKSNTVQSYNETSAMYKNPEPNRNVVDQNIPRISLIKSGI